jgi:ABC-2 type transport system permease protein
MSKIKLSNFFYGILIIAYRDVLKLVRDRKRLIGGLIFPFASIAILGSSLDANLSKTVGFNFLIFVYLGVITQNMFSSTASGIAWLIEDRQNDFSQTFFVAPISRYTIIFGKVLGESIVAYTQIFGLALIGFIAGVELDFLRFFQILPILFLICFFGGAFGVLIMANFMDKRSIDQVFPFFIFPQFFLSGVFIPMKDVPEYLIVLSRITPLFYAVDFVRGLYYFGKPEYDLVVVYNPFLNLGVMILMFFAFIGIGTYIFVKSEKER